MTNVQIRTGVSKYVIYFKLWKEEIKTGTPKRINHLRHNSTSNHNIRDTLEENGLLTFYFKTTFTQFPSEIYLIKIYKLIN